MTMPSNTAQARNEALYREVNEQIEAVSHNLSPDDRAMEFLCECDRPDCREKVNVTRGEYESVRAVSTHFIVLPGHQDPKIEHVAVPNERYLVVEKEGEAAREAEATDPREQP
jgi:hypothetical protein